MPVRATSSQDVSRPSSLTTDQKAIQTSSGETGKKWNTCEVSFDHSKIAERLHGSSAAHPRLTSPSTVARSSHQRHNMSHPPGIASPSSAHKLLWHSLLMTVTSISAARGKTFPLISQKQQPANSVTRNRIGTFLVTKEPPQSQPLSAEQRKSPLTTKAHQ